MVSLISVSDMCSSSAEDYLSVGSLRDSGAYSGLEERFGLGWGLEVGWCSGLPENRWEDG